MYSIFVLGMIMILHSFGLGVPEYASPVATFLIIGFFFWKSRIEINGNQIYGHKTPKRI